MFVLIFFLLKETLPKEKQTSGGFRHIFTAIMFLIKDKLFLGYALAMGLASGAMFAYIAGSPFVLQEIFNVTPQLFSIVFAINACGLITASQITGRLASRFGEDRFLLIGLIILLTGGISLLSFTLIGTGIFLF